MKLSKNNKERVYEFITTYSLEYEHDEYPRFTTNFLSQKLNMQRTNLSSILNQLVNEGKLIKQKGRPVMYQYINLSEEAEQVFKRLIGYDQSLKDAVAGAKARFFIQRESLVFLSLHSEDVEHIILRKQFLSLL